MCCQNKENHSKSRSRVVSSSSKERLHAPPPPLLLLFQLSSESPFILVMCCKYRSTSRNRLYFFALKIAKFVMCCQNHSKSRSWLVCSSSKGQLHAPPPPPLLLFQLSSQSAFIPIFFGYFMSSQNLKTLTQFQFSDIVRERGRYFSDIVKTGKRVTKPLKKADRLVWPECVGLEVVTREKLIFNFD